MKKLITLCLLFFIAKIIAGENTPIKLRLQNEFKSVNQSINSNHEAKKALLQQTDMGQEIARHWQYFSKCAERVSGSQKQYDDCLQCPFIECRSCIEKYRAWKDKKEYFRYSKEYEKISFNFNLKSKGLLWKHAWLSSMIDVMHQKPDAKREDLLRTMDPDYVILGGNDMYSIGTIMDKAIVRKRLRHMVNELYPNDPNSMMERIEELL